MYSVIIPAKNESRNIARCIRSAFASVNERKMVEVIVVDNASSDDTREIAMSEGAKVLIDGNANISGLRNLGAKSTFNEIIGFLDADCEVIPGWLENAETILSDQTVGVVGDYYELPNDPCWIESSYFSSLPRAGREVGFLSGGNMVIRRETFLEVSGFDENLVTGEDYVLCLKLRAKGYKVVSDPSVSVIHHGNPKTLLQLFKKEIWYGLGMFDLLRYGKCSLPLLWSMANIILLLGVLFSLLSGYLSLAVSILFFVFLLPVGAVSVHSWRNSNSRHFVKLYLFFATYGFARTISVIYLFKKMIMSTLGLRCLSKLRNIGRKMVVIWNSRDRSS